MSSKSGRLRLTLAIGDHPATKALKSGAVEIEGVDAEFINIVPQIAAFRRMVRDVEFDVCELASTTYLIARSFGAPFIALPIFLFRKFHHAGLLVRPDSGIQNPRDLEGKKVGARAYSVTTCAWTRGILIEEYGLDNSKVTWVVDDEEHVVQLKLPPNVIHAPPGRSLAAMMAAGELQAGFGGNAGVGREGPPVAGWNASATSAQAAYRDLIPDAATREAEWYRRTGIYPVHGAVVLKESLLKEHPWLAEALSAAFQKAKDIWLAKLRAGEESEPIERAYKALMPIVGDDPLPYGVEINMPTIEGLQRLCVKQGLITEALPLERAFHRGVDSVFRN